MAIKSRVINQSIILTLNLGKDKNGKSTLKTLSIKGLKPQVDDDLVFGVAEALKSALIFNIEEVSRGTVTEILSE